MEIFCKQFSKKSHYILHRRTTRSQEAKVAKEEKKKKAPKKVSHGHIVRVLDEEGVETQVIKNSSRIIKNNPEFFTNSFRCSLRSASSRPGSCSTNRRRE